MSKSMTTAMASIGIVQLKMIFFGFVAAGMESVGIYGKL